MIRFSILGIQFSLPLLTLFFPFLALRLGMRGNILALVLALGIHEGAHVLAARFLGVTIHEIRLTPFGGSARMENPYRLSSRQLAFTAAAGPLANLLLALLASALALWELLPFALAQEITQPNLVLFLFNLLPALPLDGGRILYATTTRPLGQERALMLGLWLGRLLAALLLLSTTWAGMNQGKWNLTLILASIFILASGMDERKAFLNSQTCRFSDLLRAESGTKPALLYHIDIRSSAHSILIRMRPRTHAWFILTRNGRPVGAIDDRSILEYLLKNNAPDTLLEDLPYFRLHPGDLSGAYKTSSNA